MAVDATIDEQLVAQRDDTVMFAARRKDLRLVKIPRYPQFGASGQKVGELAGETLQFRDGVLPVPATGTITLEDGREADAAEILAWLEGHKLLGNLEEGFFKVDVSAPAVSDEEQRAVMRAVARVKVDVLETMLEQERAGWAREGFIETLEEALGEVREILAEAAKQQGGGGE